LGFSSQAHLQLGSAASTYRSFAWCCGFYLKIQLLCSCLLCRVILSEQSRSLQRSWILDRVLEAQHQPKDLLSKLLSCAYEPAGSLTILYWQIWVTKAFTTNLYWETWVTKAFTTNSYGQIWVAKGFICVQAADLPLHTSAWIPTVAWQMHLPFTVYQGALRSTCPVSGAQAVPGVLLSPWTPPSGSPLLLGSSSCRRSW